MLPRKRASLDFELTDSNGARLSGEAPNFALTSLGGLLVPGGPAFENADSTYTISYASQLGQGVDTLVVTDLLSVPPLTDSLEVFITIYPDSIRSHRRRTVPRALERQSRGARLDPRSERESASRRRDPVLDPDLERDLGTPGSSRSRSPIRATR